MPGGSSFIASNIVHETTQDDNGQKRDGRVKDIVTNCAFRILISKNSDEKIAKLLKNNIEIQNKQTEVNNQIIDLLDKLADKIDYLDSQISSLDSTADSISSAVSTLESDISNLSSEVSSLQ